MLKICETCGKEFEAKNPKRIYCSEKCRRKHNYTNYGEVASNNSVNVISKTCPICGKTFKPESKKRIFCSNECRHKNDYIKYVKPAVTRFMKTEKYKIIRDRYELSHPNRIKIMKKRIRLEAMNYISDELKCSNPSCLVPGGCRDIRALQIDHINGGGNKESREIGKGFRNYQIRYWKYILSLPREEARKRYAILCANCNFIKLFENNEFTKR